MASGTVSQGGPCVLVVPASIRPEFPAGPVYCAFPRLCTPLSVGNSAQLAWKQSLYPMIISICVSLRSYMLDVVAIFAVELPSLRLGRWPD